MDNQYQALFIFSNRAAARTSCLTILQRQTLYQWVMAGLVTLFLT